MEWVNIINKHISESQGYKHSLSAPKSEFWKQEQISVSQFIELADTFDILLFKSMKERKSTDDLATRKKLGK